LRVIVVDTPHRRHCNTSVSSSGSRSRTARSCILSSQTGQAPSLEHALAKVDEAATAAADDLDVQGPLTEARRNLEQVLASYRKSLGSEHPDTATDPHNLARYQGDLAAARPLFERVLAIYEKVLGPEVSEIAIIRIHLGDLAAARPLVQPPREGAGP
jgi:hypothetical protein